MNKLQQANKFFDKLPTSVKVAFYYLLGSTLVVFADSIAQGKLDVEALRYIFVTYLSNMLLVYGRKLIELSEEKS